MNFYRIAPPFAAIVTEYLPDRKISEISIGNALTANFCGWYKSQIPLAFDGQVSAKLPGQRAIF